MSKRIGNRDYGRCYRCTRYASSIPARGFVPRRRFQKGNIMVRGKTPTGYGMYREDVFPDEGNRELTLKVLLARGCTLLTRHVPRPRCEF